MAQGSIALPLLLVLIFSLTISRADASPGDLRKFTLDRVELVELEAPSQDVHRRISRALAQVGMFAVRLPQSSSEAVQAGLRSFAGCAANGAVSLAVSRLGDGSERTSLALAVNASVRQPLPRGVSENCPGFSATSGALRAVAEHAGAAAARLMDGLVQGAVGEFDSFADAVASSESLEHFHFYRPDAQEPPLEGRPGVAVELGEARAALEMHSDVGLFLVMAPAALLQADTLLPVADSAPGAGLRLRLPGGEVVMPEVPPGSLLVMMGEAAERWMSLPPTLALHAPAHEVIMPQRTGAVRAWYGRMFFPPESARLAVADDNTVASSNLTWGEYRKQTMDAFVRGAPTEASLAGCGPGAERLGDEETCPHGYAYCWMTCMSLEPLEGLCKPEDAICVDNNGKLWPDAYMSPAGKKLHCMDCHMDCPEAPAPEDDGGMCIRNLTATVMWMSGFQTLADIRGQPCIAFLFEWFPIYSPMSFAAAVALTVLGGVSVEGIVYARRQILSHPFKIRSRASRAAFSLGMVLIYALQVTVGYLLMLVAMTYQLELFVAVVAGLCIGHAFFNAKGPVLDSAEACCMALDAWTPFPDDPPSALQRQLSDPSNPLHTEAHPCCAPAGAAARNSQQDHNNMHEPLLTSVREES